MAKKRRVAKSVPKAKAKTIAKAKSKAKAKAPAKAKPARKRAAAPKQVVAKAKPKAPPARKPAPKKAAKPKGVAPVPEGYSTITPYLIVKGLAAALDFYRRAFGAIELVRMPGPDGSVVHAELRIGQSMLMLGESCPDIGVTAPEQGRYTGVNVHLYVPDCDRMFAQALEAGAQVVMPLTNMFWGDRFGKLVDPFGHHWSVSTHVEDVTPEQMQERMAAEMLQPAAAGEACGTASSAPGGALT